MIETIGLEPAMGSKVKPSRKKQPRTDGYRQIDFLQNQPTKDRGEAPAPLTEKEINNGAISVKWVEGPAGKKRVVVYKADDPWEAVGY